MLLFVIQWKWMGTKAVEHQNNHEINQFLSFPYTELTYASYTLSFVERFTLLQLTNLLIDQTDCKNYKIKIK